MNRWTYMQLINRINKYERLAQRAQYLQKRRLDMGRDGGLDALGLVDILDEMCALKRKPKKRKRRIATTENCPTCGRFMRLINEDSNEWQCDCPHLQKVKVNAA